MCFCKKHKTKVPLLSSLLFRMFVITLYDPHCRIAYVFIPFHLRNLQNHHCNLPNHLNFHHHNFRHPNFHHHSFHRLNFHPNNPHFRLRNLCFRQKNLRLHQMYHLFRLQKLLHRNRPDIGTSPLLSVLGQKST